MKKIIFFITAMCLFAMHGCQKDIEAPINDIAIADKVYAAAKTATISGTVECPVSITKIELWIDSDENFSNRNVHDIKLSDKAFSILVNGFNINTTYYYKYVVYTAVDMAELEKKNFITMDGTLPSITTAEVSSITANSAVCGGNVTSDGNLTVTARGVCWSTSPNPTRSNNRTNNGTGTGSFTSNVTGLADGTTYYVRAYATNSKGTAYGAEKSFTTLAKTIPQITTANVTSITTNTAVCGGNVTSDGNLDVTARGVCWSTSPNPTISNNKTTNGSGTGSFTSNITGLTENTTYYVRAYAANSKGVAYGEEKSFTTIGTTGTLAGHDWVDLGLPSGLKWATCNVGASQPHEYGNYYAWGETTTKASYDQFDGVTEGQQISDFSGNATYDAARANWGSTWRMPTKAEMEELRNNCTWTWTTESGVNGYRVTGTNGNSIFLPAAGWCKGTSRYDVGELGDYWSSTPLESDAFGAYELHLFSGYHIVNWDHRSCGLTVRPVSD